VDYGTAAAVLLYRIPCVSELTGVDGGDNLFGEGVVFNQLLVDWVSHQNVAIRNVETMRPNSCASKHGDGHSGKYENRRDELGQAAFAALSEERLADVLRSSRQRGFSGGGHIS
jgi:hypothetical protein